VSRRTQPPLFEEPCLVCRYAVPGEHEPYCPAFMRGAEPGGDPAEWPTLLDAIEETPAPLVRVVDIDTRLAEARAEIEALDAGTHPALQRGDEAA
jgi:hypothetical protein